MPPRSLPLVAADDIVRLVGPAASARGQEYAKNSVVRELEWANGVLTGTVSGTRATPYRCRVELVEARPGYHRPASSRCDCPVAVDCKHAAATMFESNRRHVQELPSADTATLSRATTVRRATTGTAASAPAGQGWRTELAPADRPLPAGAPTPLGLLFELRVLTAQRHRFRGPTAAVAKAPLDPAADYRLAVRPVIPTGTGSWTRSAVTWSSMSFKAAGLALDPAQHRWFAQFAALARSSREMFHPQEAEWLYLDDFDSTLLWQLLDDAAGLAVQLVSGKKSTDVSVGQRARIEVEATSDADALLLETAVTIDGERVERAGARAIGDHGIYAATLSKPPTFRIAPTAGPMNHEVRRTLRRPAVRVPPEDVAEFTREYFPRLGRIVPVTDAGGILPALPSPELQLVADFGAGHRLRLDWGFLYGEVRRPLDAEADDAALRDTTAEAALLARVREVAGEELPRELTGVVAAEFAATVLPELRKLPSVRVDVSGEPADYRELTAPPHLKITATESDRRDWFDLGVTVTVEGKTVPFSTLLAALVAGRPKLMLIDGSYLSLTQPAFEELKRLVAEAGELAEWETGPRISRYRADLWEEFEDLADETVAAQSWRAAARGLLDTSSIEHVELPVGVDARLRPYQQHGFDWLAFLHRHRLGGILADDMGLGKTLQALALIAHSRTVDDADLGSGSAPPFLVVAPTSVVSNWVSEAERYAPGLMVRSVTATEAKASTNLAEASRGVDAVITSYALFRLDFAVYRSLGWSGLVLDEAQFVKNPASKAHQCAVELDAPVKFALTGTPMENSLLDLWALFAIVAPGLFPSKRRFTEEYVTPITRGEVPEHAVRRTAQLRRRIRPLMLRRTKELVAAELPSKQEQALRVDLAPRHRRLYDTFLQRERQKLLGLIADLDRNRFTVFRSLTLLRMLSLDAALIDDDYADIPSAKLDALLERMADVAAEGHRALVFSQFTTFLTRAAERLDAAGIAYEYLDGSTLQRASVIDRFRDGDAPAFLISLKAGGFGLNLTEADYVFLLDPWWNPATEAQAVDRTHRIGQTRPVHVYRMVATGTIEEKVMALRDRKAALFDAVLEDDAVFSSTLTADDIRGLLEQ